jgi:hypothetical protein
MVIVAQDMPRSRGGWLWSVRQNGRLVDGWLNEREARGLAQRLRDADAAGVYQNRP